MRKLFFILGLVLAVAFGAVAAETVTLTLTDGVSQAGDIIKFNDNGLMLRTAGDIYTNVLWGQLSQESLKQLAQDPKLNSKPPTVASMVEPFIEPDASQRPAKAEIRVNPVTRMERPAQPSLLGGLVGSPVGLFILLLLYAANLYAGYEVSIIRARPVWQVIGLASVLPVIGPVVFLALPMRVEVPPEEVERAAPAGTAAAAAQRTPEEIQIIEASWRKEEKKPEPQVFARGKFTFNKRFVETKFVGYIGEPKGDALKFSMEVTTAAAHFAVERIMQVAATDVIFETTQPAQVTVALNDILEIKLTPKPA